MNTELLNTDELFKVLPSFVNKNGVLYHFNLIKGNNGILVWYAKNKSEGGEYLDETYRRGKTLKDALKSMLDWLIQFNYLSELQMDALQNINKELDNGK